MTIPISEVLEEAARECDKLHDALLQSPGEFSDGSRIAALQIADEIRALAAKYEGCIVADRHPSTIVPGIDVPLYRAKEPK